MKRWAIAVGLFLTACSAAMGQETSARQSLIADRLGIDLEPYEEAGWPDLFARYGAETVNGVIQDLRAEAADRISGYRECDRVLWSEYAPSRSTQSRPAVYADCASGFRLYWNADGLMDTEQNMRLD